ncbi:hypothetical protein L0U85_09580 [Glycomyces sp. L485]|uniref:hypothetical protein n=1 Tax=Glycomyces sp. L485 TaxID=2909235 RepID=UPI001F4B1459|nr:hypothetical protein [Glycomyces sp. L485]MCH7231101.1 hypothetical protein [Glycomyces sp. L485]
MARARKNPPRQAKAAGGKVVAKVLDDAKVFRTAKGGGKKPDIDKPKDTDVTPSQTPKRKTDDELRQDAQTIHDTVKADRRRHNGTTVATAQDADGKLYYSVSGNRTAPAMEAKAQELGYERIFGKKYTSVDPKQTHAEQIMLNATDQGRLKPPLRLSPSRQPCDRSNSSPDSKQFCEDRTDNYDGADLAGW